MKDIDDIWDQADSADNDITWASLRYSAGLLTKQADNNYEDADMEKIQYDQQEAKLVYQAQEMMVSLKQSAYNLENLQSTRELLQKQYEAAQAQLSVGMATQTDVLTALKRVTGSGQRHFNCTKEPGKRTQKFMPYVRLECRCTA